MQLRRNWFVVFAVGVASILTLASCKSVVVDNQGFETPVVASGAQLFPQGEMIGAWEVTHGSVDVVRDDLWRPSNGQQSLDMTGVSPGAIAQDFATISGHRYVVWFALAGNPLCAPVIKELVVEWDGVELAHLEFDTSGRSSQNMGWRTHAVGATASGSTSGLQFRSLTDGSNDMFCGPALDNVRIVDLDAD